MGAEMVREGDGLYSFSLHPYALIRRTHQSSVVVMQRRGESSGSVDFDETASFIDFDRPIPVGLVAAAELGWSCRVAMCGGESPAVPGLSCTIRWHQIA